MADDFGVYDISGQLQTVASSTLPGTQPNENSRDWAVPVTGFVPTTTNSQFSVLLDTGSSFKNIDVQVGDTYRFKINGLPAEAVIIETGLYSGPSSAPTWPYIRIPGSLTGAEDFSTGVIYRFYNKAEELGLNRTRKKQRKLYNRYIQGRAFKYEVGDTDYVPNPNTVVPVSASGLHSPGVQLAVPPAWTQVQIGKHHEFVIGELSSSYHEVVSANTFLSGTAPLENTAVPASGNLYYSKQTKLVKLTYKLSASANMPAVPDFTAPNPTAGQDFLEFDDTFIGSYSGSFNFPWNMTWPTNVKIFITTQPGGWTGGPMMITGTNGSGVAQTERVDVTPILNGGTINSSKFFKTITDFNISNNIGQGVSAQLFSGPSIQLTGTWGATGIGSGPSQIENKPRNIFTAGSGSYRNNSIYNPAYFDIDIPDYGKIRDIKVWVEVVHDHRGGTGTGSADASNIFWCGGSGSNVTDTRVGLQGLQIALRSPNVTFLSAHPLWNSQYAQGYLKRPDPNLTSLFQGIPELHQSSYLLWAGHACEGGLGITLGGATSSLPDKRFDVTTVSTSSHFAETGNNVSLAVDRNNRAHAIWLQTGTSDTQLAYGRFGPSGWAIKILTGSTQASFNPAEWNRIRVTSNNQPRVVWTDNPPSGGTPVKFAYSNDDGVTWTIETVRSASLAGFPVDMVLDQNDVPMVAYAGFNDGVLHFAKRQGVGLWKDETASVGGLGSTGVDDTVAIGIDSQQRPHILSLNNDEGRLRHSVSGTNGWTTEYPPFETSAFGTNVDFVFDSQDQIHAVIRYDQVGDNNGRLKYIVSGSNGWVSSSLTSQDGDPIQSSAGGDHGRIAYDSGSGRFALTWGSFEEFTDIRFAMLAPNGLTRRLAVRKDSTTAPREISDVAFDTFGNVHGLYNASENGTQNLKYFVSTGAIQTVAGIKSVVRPVPPTSSAYLSFDTDIDMRTIFTDSSNYANPRHLGHLYNGNVSDFPTRGLMDRRMYASPTSGAFLDKFKYPGMELTYDTPNFMTGANIPWFLDDSIPPGNFRNRTHSFATGTDGTVLATGSIPIPTGWISSGTAGVNEWPTHGLTVSANDMRPVYPLLDDVSVEKVFDEPSKTGVQSINPLHPRIVGFRPGLRGTEIHGKWRLMIGNTADWNAGFMIGTTRGGFWFRQLRLEFTVDQGQGAQHPYASKGLRFKLPGYVAHKPGRRLIQVLSGSAAWDIGVNRVYQDVPEEYGRSVGITSDSGSTSFAVYTRLTGALVDALSAAGQYNQVASSYLSNEFGTPYIPLSSGSGVAPSFDAFTSEDASVTRQTFKEVLNPTTLVPRDNTLRAFLARSKVATSTRDALLKKLSE